jgi:hypothetical protein
MVLQTTGDTVPPDRAELRLLRLKQQKKRLSNRVNGQAIGKTISYLHHVNQQHFLSLGGAVCEKYLTAEKQYVLHTQ